MSDEPTAKPNVSTSELIPNGQALESQAQETKENEESKMWDAYGFEVNATEAKKDWSKEKIKKVEKTNDRLEKWLQMINNWNANKAKVKSRCRKGIPDALRGVIWMKLTGADELKANARKNYYQELTFEHPEKECAIVINKDLTRTFPKHSIFQKHSTAGLASLKNVLSAYAVHDKEVGYCQGMAFHAALFLMYLTEEDAFWLFVSVFSDEGMWKMRGLFSKGLPLLRQRFFQLEKLIGIFCPALSRKFTEANILPSYYATKWFMNGFAHVLPFPIVIRIWDMYLSEGNKIIFRIAIQCLKENESTLLKLNLNNQDEEEQFLKLLQNIDQNIDTEQLLKNSLNLKLTSSQINTTERQWQESETML